MRLADSFGISMRANEFHASLRATIQLSCSEVFDLCESAHAHAPEVLAAESATESSICDDPEQEEGEAKDQSLVTEYEPDKALNQQLDFEEAVVKVSDLVGGDLDFSHGNEHVYEVIYFHIDVGAEGQRDAGVQVSFADKLYVPCQTCGDREAVLEAKCAATAEGCHGQDGVGKQPWMADEVEPASLVPAGVLQHHLNEFMERFS
jgi:hypothetical protein